MSMAVYMLVCVCPHLRYSHDWIGAHAVEKVDGLVELGLEFGLGLGLGLGLELGFGLASLSEMDHLQVIDRELRAVSLQR